MTITNNQPARCPHCGGKGHTDHDSDVPCAICQPAPAPLPVIIEATLKGLGDGYPGAELTLRAHISDLTRRLAESERRSNTWREQAHKNCRDMELIAKRLEAAEARIADLEAQLSGVGVRQYREAVERLHKAEARVRELEADNREVTHEMLCIKAERDALRIEVKAADAAGRLMEAQRDALREQCDGLESDANCERIKRKCAEGRTQEMKMAIARYLAEKKQPGSDRRAESAALASLHALAATEEK